MNEKVNENGKVVKRAILFVRVSTDQQSAKSQGAQEDTLITFAEGKGFDRSEMIIIKPIEGGESAVKLSLEERKTIQDMYEVINDPQNKIEAIFAWALDRLSRRPKDLYELRDFFIARKINLMTYELNLCLFDETGKETIGFNYIFGLLTTSAEDEGRKRSLRTMQGKKKRSENGYAINGCFMFGYYKDENKKLQIDPEQAKIVELIFKLYSTGTNGILAIQKELEIKGLAIDTHKISKILTYRLYTGERVEGVFNRQLPQIISKELFEKCRKVATAKDSKATKTKRIYYAGRLIKCSDCGSYLTARPNTNVIQYTCHHKYSKLTKRECNANDRISVNVIDSIAWYYARLKETEFIQELNEDKLKDWERQISELQTKIDNAENQYEAIKNKKRKELKRTIKSLSDKAIEQLVNDETKEEKKRIQNDVIGYKTSIGHLSEYVEQTKKNISFHESLDSFWSVFSNLKNMSDKERSDIVHKHICEIRIKNMSDTDTPTKQIDIEFFDGTIKKVFYAFRQRSKDLRVYEYDISTPCPFPYLRGDKLYKNWDEIYINRFECSQ